MGRPVQRIVRRLLRQGALEQLAVADVAADRGVELDGSVGVVAVRQQLHEHRHELAVVTDRLDLAGPPHEAGGVLGDPCDDPIDPLVRRRPVAPDPTTRRLVVQRVEPLGCSIQVQEASLCIEQDGEIVGEVEDLREHGVLTTHRIELGHLVVGRDRRVGAARIRVDRLVVSAVGMAHEVRVPSDPDLRDRNVTSTSVRTRRSVPTPATAGPQVPT